MFTEPGTRCSEPSVIPKLYLNDNLLSAANNCMNYGLSRDIGTNYPRTRHPVNGQTVCQGVLLGPPRESIGLREAQSLAMSLAGSPKWDRLASGPGFQHIKSQH